MDKNPSWLSPALYPKDIINSSCSMRTSDSGASQQSTDSGYGSVFGTESSRHYFPIHFHSRSEDSSHGPVDYRRAGILANQCRDQSVTDLGYGSIRDDTLSARTYHPTRTFKEHVEIDNGSVLCPHCRKKVKKRSLESHLKSDGCRISQGRIHVPAPTESMRLEDELDRLPLPTPLTTYTSISRTEAGKLESPDSIGYGDVRIKNRLFTQSGTLANMEAKGLGVRNSGDQLFQFNALAPVHQHDSDRTHSGRRLSLDELVQMGLLHPGSSLGSRNTSNLSKHDSESLSTSLPPLPLLGVYSSKQDNRAGSSTLGPEDEEQPSAGNDRDGSSQTRTQGQSSLLASSSTAGAIMHAIGPVFPPLKPTDVTEQTELNSGRSRESPEKKSNSLYTITEAGERLVALITAGASLEDRIPVIQESVPIDATPEIQSTQNEPISIDCLDTEVVSSELSESPVYDFGYLSQTPESANQLVLLNPAASYLKQLIQEYKSCSDDEESEFESVGCEENWQSYDTSERRQPVPPLETMAGAHTGGCISFSESSFSTHGQTSGNSGYGVSASQSSLGPSDESSQDSGIPNPSKRSSERDDDEDDSKQDRKRQRMNDGQRWKYHEIAEMILCIRDNCPGQNPSISEWLRKLRTAHGIFICSRCWTCIEKDQYERHVAEKKCDDRCVCDSAQSELCDYVVQSPHNSIPGECAKNQKRLKKCQYLYICKLLNVQPRDFKRDCIKPHHGEKQRRRQRIVDDIVSEAEAIQARCAHLESRMEIQKSQIAELKGIILQFKELTDCKGIAVPRSLLLRIKDHCPDILETEDILMPNSSPQGCITHSQLAANLTQDPTISLSPARAVTLHPNSNDNGGNASAPPNNVDFQEYLDWFPDEQDMVRGAPTMY